MSVLRQCSLFQRECEGVGGSRQGADREMDQMRVRKQCTHEQIIIVPFTIFLSVRDKGLLFWPQAPGAGKPRW